MKIHLVGGFLGSGKTTAISAVARHLVNEGKKVGIITNDQGKFLVDSQFFLLEDFPSVEVTGGCFCCNYGNFSDSIDQLANEIQPDYIFAESVGSCTDLVATVIQPLLDLKDRSTEDVTFSVMCDSRLLLKFLSGEDLPFQEGILYIFEKQIEEAGLLVMNKSDLLSEKQNSELHKLVLDKYKNKVVISQNSLKDNGIDNWLTILDSGLILPGSQLDLDYQIYGAGEKSLAWFDGDYRIEFRNENIRYLLQERISELFQNFRKSNIGVGHLKFLISDQSHYEKISFVSLESENYEPKIRADWNSPLSFSINARLECGSEEISDKIKKIVIDNLEEKNIRVDVLSEQAFHPGFPNPTYRYSK